MQPRLLHALMILGDNVSDVHCASVAQSFSIALPSLYIQSLLMIANYYMYI